MSTASKEKRAEIEKVIAKELAKRIKEKPEGIPAKLVEAASKGMDLTIKTGIFVDKDLNKEAGLVVEVFETNSKIKILDGISLDIGATTKSILAGVAKDFAISELNFSLGVYGSVNTRDVINTIRNKSIEIDPKVKIGLTLEL